MLLLCGCTSATPSLEPLWLGTGLVDGARVEVYLAVSPALGGDARDHAIDLLDAGSTLDDHTIHQVSVQTEALDPRPEDAVPLLADAPGYAVWCGLEQCGDDVGSDLSIHADAGTCGGATTGPLPLRWVGQANATDMEVALDVGPTGCAAPDGWLLEAVDPAAR